jgi:hypothetical protein
VHGNGILSKFNLTDCRAIEHRCATFYCTCSWSGSRAGLLLPIVFLNLQEFRLVCHIKTQSLCVSCLLSCCIKPPCLTIWLTVSVSSSTASSTLCRSPASNIAAAAEQLISVALLTPRKPEPLNNQPAAAAFCFQPLNQAHSLQRGYREPLRFPARHLRAAQLHFCHRIAADPRKAAAPFFSQRPALPWAIVRHALAWGYF